MREPQYTTAVMPANAPQALASAIAYLRQGQVIAFPTDTVYGVGCDLWQADAMERLYWVKQRPKHMAIPLLTADLASVDNVALNLSESFLCLAERFWPGELTLIARRCPEVPAIVTAGGDTIALRMPDLPLARQLCAALGGCLAVTSANLSGSPACVTAEDVLRGLAGRIPLILDGGTYVGGVASTIVDCVSDPPKVLRQGNLSLASLRAVLPLLQ